MTDRHNAYLVILDEEYREDDAAPIRTALNQIEGVAGVEPAAIDRPELTILHQRMRMTLFEKIDEAFEEGP